MENQYPYGNSRDRSQYNTMIRTMQSPSVGSGAHSRFEGYGGDMQHGGLPRASVMSNPYGQQGSYGQLPPLPPLHTRPQEPQQHHQAGYGQVPVGVRPAQSPPASGSGVGYPGSYMPQSGYPAQFSSNAPLAPYSQPQHMGMQSGVMPYQPEYHSATTGMADMRSLTATTHPQSMSDPMAHQPYHVSPTSEEYARAQHVVGAQGRRGILPSDEGRPPAIGPSRTSRNAMVPQKDANGKFPCPHCNKTYLHAKHLKRHMLRHTGDRPYSCGLCNDTFSRSDILKRHFSKCSARRGNPSGMTHLSNSPSYLRKQAKAAANGQTTAQGSGAQDPARPLTSASASSGGSSQHSGDAGMEHPLGSAASPTGPAPPHAGPPMTMPGGGRAGSNASSVTHSAPQSAVSQFGPGGILHSPATSPGNARPPLGFYEDPYHQHSGYMGS